MNSGTTALRDSLLILASIAILLTMARESSDIFVPFLLSMFIAIVAARPLNWLKNRGLSTFVSVTIVVAAIVTFIARESGLYQRCNLQAVKPGVKS
jgi:predicted PurR-regulated permease PerM